MRRYLVLTTESARHPFRASLPREIFTVPPEPIATPVTPKPAARAELGDLGFFVMSFVSGFIIIFGMIV